MFKKECSGKKERNKRVVLSGGRGLSTDFALMKAVLQKQNLFLRNGFVWVAKPFLASWRTVLKLVSPFCLRSFDPLYISPDRFFTSLNGLDLEKFCFKLSVCMSKNKNGFLFFTHFRKVVITYFRDSKTYLRGPSPYLLRRWGEKKFTFLAIGSFQKLLFFFHRR